MGMRALLGLVLIAYGCNGAPTGPTPPADIGGRVIDFNTGAGVSGTTVTFGQPLYTNGTFVPSNARVAVSDANGLYNLRLPGLDRYTVWIDDRQIGSAQVASAAYRGDLLVRSGGCVSRYGTVADAVSGWPISNVSVMLAGRTVATDDDGWYRIDLGCPANGLYGFNTTFIYFSHPRYAGASMVVGRGVYGVFRMDITLRS